MTLLRMSLGGSLMIALTLVLRALCLHRLPKRVFVLLWGLCALRLLLPFSLPVLQVPQEAYVPQAAGAAVPGTADALSALAAHGRAFLAGGGLRGLYALGLAAAALYFARAYVRSRRLLRTALPLGRRAQGVPLYESDRIRTPLTYGAVRPRIVLPAGLALAGEALADALAHELSHVQSRDVLKKLLLLSAALLHWFNPLAWVMYALCQRDIELCCDERVLRARGESARRGYALSLIALAERCRTEGPLCVSFGRRAVEERVMSIMKWRRPTFAGLAACALMGVTMTGALAATSLTYAPQETAALTLSTRALYAADMDALGVDVAPAGMEGSAPRFVSVTVASPASLAEEVWAEVKASVLTGTGDIVLTSADAAEPLDAQGLRADVAIVSDTPEYAEYLLTLREPQGGLDDASFDAVVADVSEGIAFSVSAAPGRAQ